MGQSYFTELDIAKAEAIVRIFETGEPLGDPTAVAVLNDGAGISYGVKQFTHRSGSLLQVVEAYLGLDGQAGCEVIIDRLPILQKRTKAAIQKLAGDGQFKNALRAAGATREMQEAQRAVAYERYMQPAVKECEAFGFELPLSLAVVYDSMVHGSWERLASNLGPVDEERSWIKRYLEERDEWLRQVPRLRATAYRTKFFLTQVKRDNWGLSLPLNVNGYALTEKLFNSPETHASQPPAADPTDSLPDPHQTGRGGGDEKAAAAAPAETLDAIEARVNAVAARVDQVERIAVTTATRTDKAKSLWTTVAGTLWQMAWAVGGFLTGLPWQVWLIVALVAGALMVMFLYRQIVLGRIREAQE
jgi:chitosanase